MDKKTILFVGEDPASTTGNGHMMQAVLDMLKEDRYNIACFAASEVPPWAGFDIFAPPPFRLIPASDGRNPWGEQKLLRIIQTATFDALIMVGIDLWRYFPIFKNIYDLKKRKGFKWIWLFPYDLQDFRQDWADWINMMDFPCAYSKYGEQMLKDAVPHIQYFRPPLAYAEMYRPYDADKRRKIRERLFPNVRDDQFVFGFVGPNQKRKDPQRLIKAFRMVKEQYPDSMLYLHTRVDGHKNGNFNLIQYLNDMGLSTGDILTCGGTFTEQGMVDVYNAIDCLVNCSMQEGLSWTPLNAMLCGTPIIASDTTAQTELVENVGMLVPLKNLDFLPLAGKNGNSWIETGCCRPEDIAEAMVRMIALPEDEKDLMVASGIVRGKDWLSGISDINELLEEAFKPVPVKKKMPAVLFAQHSAAGDVYMTTRCFKGIKERFPGKHLTYMTSPQYMGIVEGNPYIDEVIPWDEKQFNKYEIILNPHADRILPGHWGRNCNSILSDFYWKILDVEPDDFFIQQEEPFFYHYVDTDRKVADTKLSFYEYLEFWNDEYMPICIVHTTGGDPHFRTYKYMADVCRGLKDMGYFTIQLGGKSDYPADAGMDLRGEFSYKETAWIMDKAVLAITVDSFMSHLAGGLGISQVCLFGSGNAMVVRPNQMKGELICLVPDYVRYCKGLGPCSASVRDCPAPCTGRHDPKTILEAIKQIKSNGNIRRNFEHEKTLHRFQYAQ